MPPTTYHRSVQKKTETTPQLKFLFPRCQSRRAITQPQLATKRQMVSLNMWPWQVHLTLLNPSRSKRLDRAEKPQLLVSLQRQAVLVTYPEFSLAVRHWVALFSAIRTQWLSLILSTPLDKKHGFVSSLTKHQLPLMNCMS